jgi:signal transduction histidine kinase
MDEIYKPFFTTKVDRLGVGLGLFVTEGIVRRHNGRIWVKNNLEPDMGATFTVVLPVRPEP